MHMIRTTAGGTCTAPYLANHDSPGRWGFCRRGSGLRLPSEDSGRGSFWKTLSDNCSRWQSSKAKAYHNRMMEMMDPATFTVVPSTENSRLIEDSGGNLLAYCLRLPPLHHFIKTLTKSESPISKCKSTNHKRVSTVNRHWTASVVLLRQACQDSVSSSPSPTDLTTRERTMDGLTSDWWQITTYSTILVEWFFAILLQRCTPNLDLLQQLWRPNCGHYVESGEVVPSTRGRQKMENLILTGKTCRLISMCLLPGVFLRVPGSACGNLAFRWRRGREMWYSS